jgi:hypothetical protein
MRRLNLRLIVATLTFIVGVATASWWFMFSHPSVRGVSDKISSEPSPMTKRTYDDIVIAHGSDGGFPMGHGAITTSDGMNFSWRRITYGSPQRANKELQKKVNEAVDIINRQPNLNDQKRQVGEKVVATFPVAKGSSGVFARILWTNSSDFGYVEGSSLESILAYEKDHEH